MIKPKSVPTEKPDASWLKEKCKKLVSEAGSGASFMAFTTGTKPKNSNSAGSRSQFNRLKYNKFFRRVNAQIVYKGMFSDLQMPVAGGALAALSKKRRCTLPVALPTISPYLNISTTNSSSEEEVPNKLGKGE